jgi:hypothetical protein
MDDTPIPPPLPVPICEHDVETHVKQSRHLTTASHVYYCCCYTVMSI